MKKIILTVFVSALALSLALPGLTQAMTIKERFNGNSYAGTWQVTDDPCEPENVGNTGNIIIQALSLKRKGALKSDNAIWFDDTSLAISGRVYRKNDKFRVRFTYSITGLEGVIKGRITQKRIKGTYTHTYAGCTWKGSIIAPRQYN